MGTRYWIKTSRNLFLYFRRPETSFLWIANPWKSFRFVIWRNYKWYIIGFIILALVVLLIGLFIYSAPVSDVFVSSDRLKTITLIYYFQTFKQLLSNFRLIVLIRWLSTLLNKVRIVGLRLKFWITFIF